MAETESATPVMDAQEDADQAEAAANRGRMDSVYSTPPIGVQMSPEIPVSSLCMTVTLADMYTVYYC